MNRSTLCDIKYMNGLLFFFNGQVYDWGWFQNTRSHTRTKVTPPPPPLPEHGSAFAAIVGRSVFHSLAIHSEILA